ncbi:hypothetical protein DCAR_0625356 [Daucus carota subsp. sativus]|uniref:Uncharacterized protein n=1 Tax=Daucus carota subsp. sativus TaxID=79200 RepID=A0A164WE69_DAUCS|nr:PREDICTED: putative uncharacterized protein DDB_G0290521 [Daucus carota subsp. sativus]WOH05933.1 hypothetical protein DCAR_0625356 [Daucus carota subsp. sativus]
MAEQRPMFRFRLPWMIASAPPTAGATPSPPHNEAPSTTEPNVKPMEPAQRPFRLQSVAPAQPSPQAPPKISAAPETKTQSQYSYQPTWPSKMHTQIDSQLPSPALSSPQYSATSQLPSPSFTTPLFSSASQLPSPQSSTATSQEQDNSQLPSPKSAPRPSSPISSPQHSPPMSSPQPSSPISSPEPSSTQVREPSQTSLTSTNVQPTASSETRLPNVHISKPQLPEDLSNKEITPSVTSKSSMEATAQQTSNAAKPPESSGPLAANAGPPGIVKEMPPHKIRSDETLMAHEEPKQKTMNEATTSKHGNLVGKQTKSMKPTNNKGASMQLSSGDRASFQEEIRSDISKLVDKMATANPENFKDEKGSLVTLVGKNKGASMKLGFDLVRRGKELKIDDGNSKEDQMTEAVINNNVQDINNSILMNSFIAERSPGVHLALHYDATELITSYDKEGSPEARKGTSTLPLPKSPMSLPPEGDP